MRRHRVWVKPGSPPVLIPLGCEVPADKEHPKRSGHADQSQGAPTTPVGAPSILPFRAYPVSPTVAPYQQAGESTRVCIQ